VIEPLDATAATAFLGFGAPDGTGQTIDALQAPLYLIGLASDGELPRIPTGILDGGEFVWGRDRSKRAGAVERARPSTTASGIGGPLAAGKGMAEENASFEEEVGRRGRRLDELVEELAQLKERGFRASGLRKRARRCTKQTRRSSTFKAIARPSRRLRAIENSRSWRLTAPLRQILGAAKSAAPVEPGPPVDPAAEGQRQWHSQRRSPGQQAPLPPDRPFGQPIETSPATFRAALDCRCRTMRVSTERSGWRFLTRTLSHGWIRRRSAALRRGPLVPEFADAGRVHDFYSASSTPELRAESFAVSTTGRAHRALQHQLCRRCGS
jgi:hypothetical protein